MLILTNCARFPERWKSEKTGLTGEALVLKSFQDFVRHIRACDLVLVNCDLQLTFRLCALFALLPMLRRPLVVADLVLRKPESLRDRLLNPLKRALLAKVDHFIHHFHDLRGYEKYFGIGPDRSSFVPFKPNLRYRCEAVPDPNGDYVLCFGRSLRDFDTFFAAVEMLPYPAAIVKPDFAQLHAHASRFTRPINRLPEQVRLLDHVCHDIPSQVEVLKGAKLVVLPMLKSCLVAVGTALNAMLLGKCVILSKGPATEGLYSDEVIAVPPEDPQALADAIRRAWNDNELRERTAASGHRYALALGGEPEVHQRILEQTLSWYQSMSA